MSISFTSPVFLSKPIMYTLVSNIPYQYGHIYNFSDLTFTARSGSVGRVLDVGQRVASSELTREM